jgi:hypothetical protein
MGGGGGAPIRSEPNNVRIITQNPEALKIFEDAGWMRYFEKLKGGDRDCGHGVHVQAYNKEVF